MHLLEEFEKKKPLILTIDSSLLKFLTFNLVLQLDMTFFVHVFSNHRSLRIESCVSLVAYTIPLHSQML